MKKKIITLFMLTVLMSATTYASGSKPPPDPSGNKAPWYTIFYNFF